MKILPDDNEINQVACDEMQQDWNDLKYQEIYRQAFVDGATWLRNKVKMNVKLNKKKFPTNKKYTMKTVTINLYSFNELSKEAKEKAINRLSDVNTSFDWWDNTYEDAENIGLKLTEFNIDNKPYARGEFILSPAECAEKIQAEHGKDCETYKTAGNFLIELEALTGQYENIEDCPEDEIETLENEFLSYLLANYADILQQEYEYLTSDEATKELIEANDYIFFQDGTLTSCTTYTGKHEKAGKTEFHFHGQTIEL